MATGFVTTTRVTHATPAALYSLIAHRDWECAIPHEAEVPGLGVARDIAWQLINTAPGNRTNVILGGGYAPFMPPPPDRIEENPEPVMMS